MKSGRRSLAGMTLLELLMVVVIVAVLAAIAVPSYTRTVERGYWRQANDLLFTIYHGQRSYFLTNQEYVDGLVACGATPSTKCMGEWRKIHMDDPSSPAVAYSVTAANNKADPTKSTFTATATRAAGGPCGAKAQTMNHNRQSGGSWLISCP